MITDSLRNQKKWPVQQVANEVLQNLQSLLPENPVEKASYDDFYIDITKACQGSLHKPEGSLQGPVHVVGDAQLDSLDACLLTAAHVGFKAF